MRTSIIRVLAACAVLAATVTSGWAQAPVSKRLTSDTCPGSGCLTVSVGGMGAVAAQVVGDPDGTISFTGSTDGRTYTALTLSKIDGTGSASSTTAAGQWFGNVGGLRFVRAAFTSYGAGTPTVTLSTSTSGGGGSGGSGGSGGTVNQGTASDTEEWLVNCATGCTSASSDDDDGSIPVGSTNSNANAFLMAKGATAWERVVFGQAAMAASLPVTIANNQSAVPVSGTIDLGATDNAVLDAIAASLAGTLTVGSHAVTNAGTFAVQASVANGAIVTLGAMADDKSTATDTTAITLMQATKQISASVQASASYLSDLVTNNSLKRILSVGTTEDETEIKATAGVLASYACTNNHASANAFIKFAQLTAANTTPGTSTVWFSMLIPFGGGIVDGVVEASFSPALTAWVVLGEADTDVAEVAANDIHCSIRYR